MTATVMSPTELLRHAILAVAPTQAAAVMNNINSTVAITVGGVQVDLSLLAMAYAAISGADTVQDQLREANRQLDAANVAKQELQGRLAAREDQTTRQGAEITQREARIRALEEQLEREKASPIPEGGEAIATLPRSTEPATLGNVVVCGIDRWNKLATESNSVLLSLLNVQARLLACLPRDVSLPVAELLLVADTLNGKIEKAVLPVIQPTPVAV